MMYGALPENLGKIDISPREMMNWLYLPISTPGTGLCLPDTLWQFYPIIDEVWKAEPRRCDTEYVYITAKTLFVCGGNIGNRPGWHADGFGTDDLNFIWYDAAPTEFIEDSFELPENCADSMAIMTERAAQREIVTFPCKHLLRLTPAVIHRPPEDFSPGMRTFVKVSISPDRYNLLGNSINHKLPEKWPLVERQVERNHPAAKEVA